MEIKIDCSSGLELSINDLHDFQGDLKSLSDDDFNKLANEIIKTGFAFAPHVWRDKKNNKYYLLDGHQRIKTLKRIVKDGFNNKNYTIGKIPVVQVDAKDIKGAKLRILQSISQYGKLTGKGLADFAIDNNIKYEDFNIRFDLPNFDMQKFYHDFVENNQIVSIAAHDRKVDKVNSGNENSEWVNMPGFKPGEKEYKLILIFSNEQDREDYVKKNKVKITNKMNNQLSSRI